MTKASWNRTEYGWSLSTDILFVQINLVPPTHPEVCTFTCEQLGIKDELLSDLPPAASELLHAAVADRILARITDLVRYVGEIP